MIQWRFFIDDEEIQEPQGFAALSLTLDRHPTEHGISIEATVNTLSFYGRAFDILSEAKNEYGIDAVKIFRAEQKCEGEADYSEVINSKLNFSSYSETCGNTCLVRMTLENKDCYVTFKNRLDQKVDIDSLVAFDKVTQLQPYAGIGFTMPLATQVIPISAVANVGVGGDIGEVINPGNLFDSETFFRPIYETVIDNSIATGNLDIVASNFEDAEKVFLLTPQVLVEENSLCIPDQFQYEVRIKGTVRIEGNDSALENLTIRSNIDVWNGEGGHTANAIVLHQDNITTNGSYNTDYNFDFTHSGSTSLTTGEGLYSYIGVYTDDDNVLPITVNVYYTFDKETYFSLTSIKECPPTDCQVYLVNETLSRVTEAITDRCLTVKSDYYGRTDSQPYTSDQDGCGSLRVLTGGLQIRQATEKVFFASMKDLYEGLRPIDNIGMGLEGNNIRIEHVDYFYQDVKIMDILLVPEMQTDIEERLVYSSIKTGYNKWESKSIKGIDEYNSPKEFRTGIKAVNNTLDISSNIITAGYVIENLRTTTLVNTGNTDSTYDNDIFGICVERTGYGYQVEQGIVENAANFFSPTTAYNWRIRPIYNLMRWFKSIAQAYVNISNTTSKLFFTSGKGNYLASGNISVYDPCSLDAGPIAENKDLDYTNFKNISDATPLYKAEIITFEYPLSVADYKYIRSAPYGYLNVQCGTGLFVKGFIKTIDFKPAEGMANITLIVKWQ